MADAEQVEGLVLDRVGLVMSRKPGRSGSAGWIWLRQMVARSASRVQKLCTGRPLPACLAAALARARGERAAGATGLVRAARAAGLSSSVNRTGSEPVVHVPGEVVRQHPQEHVRPDPLFGAVADRADVQVGIEGAERPLDLGERLVGGDHLAAAQVAGGDAGPQHVNAVQGGLGDDGVPVTGVAEAVFADAGGEVLGDLAAAQHPVSAQRDLVLAAQRLPARRVAAAIFSRSARWR